MLVFIARGVDGSMVANRLVVDDACDWCSGVLRDVWRRDGSGVPRPAPGQPQGRAPTLSFGVSRNDWRVDALGVPRTAPGQPQGRAPTWCGVEFHHSPFWLEVMDTLCY